MSYVWLILLALGLCFDTFAVSVSSGISCKNISFRQACRFSLVMTVFQGTMPLLGWIAGKSVHVYMEAVDHWIAAGLLFVVAMKMILNAFSHDETKKLNPLKFSTMLGLAVATSIDAFAIGISFAFVMTDFILAIALISVFTFLSAMLGLFIGKKSAKIKSYLLELAGGIILIAIAIKILIEHL